MSRLDFLVSRINSEINREISLLNTLDWISNREPLYPIELELVLRKVSNVEKLQITAHNYYIPETIEILCKGETEDKSLGEVKFKKSKSSSTKLEMKTVYLDETCSSIAFRILGNHHLEENPENKVGLIDVKIFGKYQPEVEDHALFRNWNEDAEPAISDISGRYSKEIAKLAEIVEANKLKAVANEDFFLAKQAQLSQRMLSKAKKEMIELERDMKEAIEEEDYQRAHDLRDEIKTLRANILSNIDSKLLEETAKTTKDNVEVHRPKNLFDDEILEFPPPPPKLFSPVDLSPIEAEPLVVGNLPPRPPHSAAGRSSRTKYKPISRNGRPLSTESLKSYQKSLAYRPSSRDSIVSTDSVKANRSRRKSTGSSNRPTGNKFLDKENMIVPAAMKNKRIPNYEKEVIQIADSPTEDDLLTTIPPNERNSCSRAITCFGYSTVSKIFSKQWQNRQEGLGEVKNKLNDLNSSKGILDYFDSTVYILSRILKDSLYSVYRIGLDLLVYFVTNFMPKYQMKKNAKTLAQATCDPLISKINDTKDKRAPRETIEEFNNIITSDKKIAKAYNQVLISIDGKKADKARTQVIDSSVEYYNVPNDEAGFNEVNFRKFATGCLLNGDPEVRILGKKFFLRLYKNGDRSSARAALPNGTILRKSPLFRSLLDEMQEIDNM